MSRLGYPESLKYIKTLVAFIIINLFVTIATANGIVYCVGGQSLSVAVSANVFYAPVYPSGVLGSWVSTNAYPSGILKESCATVNGFDYCTGGIDGGSAATTNVFYAPTYGSGVLGSWVSTNAYPSKIDVASCATVNGFDYCVGGYTGYAATTNVFYAPTYGSGVLGSWVSTNAYPSEIAAHSCAPLNGFVYCVGGDTGSSSRTTNVFYAATYGSGVLGSWVSTNAYPSGIIYHSCVADMNTTFTETGLPKLGETWSVTYAGTAFSTIVPNAISFFTAAGNFVYSVPSVTSGVNTYTSSPSGGNAIAGNTTAITFTPPAMGQPSIAASNTLMDQGQYTAISSYETGGTPPYTYNFLVFNSVSNTAVAFISTTSNSYAFQSNAFWTSNSPLKANVFIYDSATTNGIANSVNSGSITVNSYPTTAITTKASNGISTNTIMYGSSVTVNALVTGGTGPFTFQWTDNGVKAVNTLVGTTGSSNTLTCLRVNNYTFNVIATDTGASNTLPQVTNTIVIVKNNTLTATVTGAGVTVPYYQAVAVTFNGVATINNQSSWALYVNGVLNTTTNSLASWQNQYRSGTFKFVFENLGNSNYTNYTAVATLSVLSPPSGGGSGTSGGGAGGGSGGTFKPVVTYIGRNCYQISNLTTPVFAVVNFLGNTPFNTSFNIRENYIAPNYTGITVNNATSYPLYPNAQPTTIRSTALATYTAQLLNISYIPAVHTVILDICANAKPAQYLNLAINITNASPKRINFTIAKTIIAILSNSSIPALAMVNITNITGGLQAPPPFGFNVLLALNVSVATRVVPIVNVTMGYNCLLPPNRIIPYKFANGRWRVITPFATNILGCAITFTIPPDPIIALMQNTTVITATATTSSTTSSISTSLTTANQTTSNQTTNKTNVRPTPPQRLLGIIPIVAIVIIVVIAMNIAYRLLKKQGLLK